MFSSPCRRTPSSRRVRGDRRRVSSSCASGSCPHATVPHPLVAGAARSRSYRAEGVLVGRVGPDRRRGDRQRRQRLPAAAVGERRPDAARARRRSRSPSSSASRSSPSTCTLGRAETDSVLSQIARAVFPAGGGDVVPLLVRPDRDLRRARPRREHVVPGLPAARRAACARPLLRPPVHEPRRPARLLERRDRPHGARDVADRHLPRERQLADPPLRGRRLHGVHALAGGMVRYWLRTGTPAGATAARSTPSAR